MKHPVTLTRAQVSAIYGRLEEPSAPRPIDPTLWIVFAVLTLFLAISYWVRP